MSKIVIITAVRKIFNKNKFFLFFRDETVEVLDDALPYEMYHVTNETGYIF